MAYIKSLKFKVVKLNPEDKREDGSFKNLPASKKSKSIEEGYRVLIVSANEKIHEVVFDSLKYFSLSGKQINILRAFSMQEARKVAEYNQDIVLVVIDNNVQLNGSYQAFISYIREELNNQVCQIAFKDHKMGLEDTSVEKEYLSEGQSELESARERLLEMIRMMMMTVELELTTEGSRLLDQISENTLARLQSNNKPSESITREKLYTILAHDIKEPIGNIKVILDFLTNEPDLLDMKTSQELLNSVKESASSIHELLDNFLFWTRMHKHEIYFNPVRINIAHLVRENITLLKGIAANKNIIIGTDVNESITVIADEYMMTTVLRNLIYNAVKFTSRGGGILVTARETDGYVELAVQDTGIGLRKAELENLFAPDVYYKSNGTSKESGTGLGLILCKDFIEKNSGKIKVESDEGFGSTFTFTLPKWNPISVN
jgi:signal transduction histidine kinase